MFLTQEEKNYQYLLLVKQNESFYNSFKDFLNSENITFEESFEGIRLTGFTVGRAFYVHFDKNKKAYKYSLEKLKKLVKDENKI